MLIVLVFGCLAGLGLTACDTTGEQIVKWKPAGTLAISSATDATPSTVNVTDTTSYYVKGYTADKDYEWTLEGGAGAEIAKVRRGGAFIDVAFREPGTYTINVDDGEYAGTLEVTAAEPEE